MITRVWSRRAIHSAACVLGLASLTAGMFAQDIPSRIEGSVLSSDGTPLAGAEVVVTGPALVGPRVVRTNEHGYYRVLLVPVGHYTVRISALGHRPVVIDQVTVELSRTTTLGAIRLEGQAVELPEMVVVADRVRLDPTTTAIGGTLRAESFTELPIERNSRSIAALLSLANTSYLGDEVNVVGASGSDNMYFIDGVNVTDGYRAASGTTLPYNFIDAIEVKQGGYEAEYGGALGGILNVITPSGTDTWQVGANGYFTNSTFAGESRPGLADLRVDRFATYDVGLRAGGPIVRNRLRFYGAYNPSIERKDFEFPGLGSRQDVRTAHYLAAKLSWHASQHTDMTLSVFGDPTVHESIGPANAIDVLPASLANPDPFLGHEETGGVNVALKVAATPRDNVVLEVFGYRHGRRENRAGRTSLGRTEPLVRDRITQEWSGGWGWYQETSAVRTGAKVAATLLVGRHTVKSGVGYQDNRLRVLTDNTVDGLGVIHVVAPELFTVLIGRRNQTVHNRVPTVFLQDSWLAADRLRVNAGIRWDGQYLIGVDGSVVQSIADQWQPRIGIVFQPGSLGSQKVTASFARYFQQLPLFMSTLAHAPWESRLRTYRLDPRLYPDSFVAEVTLADPLRPDIVEVQGLRGEHVDEIVAGYEVLTSGRRFKLGVHGMYRRLRETVGGAFDADRMGPTGVPGSFVPGNPGRDELDFVLPERRRYLAFTLTVEYRGTRLAAGGSYVLSRNHGNYTGLYGSDAGRAAPSFSLMNDFPSQGPNSTGLLPNDRTHVFKVYGSYRLTEALTAGAFFTWQSGTPLSVFGAGPLLRPIFLVQRGSAGRTPSIWDLNLRVTYDVGRLVPSVHRGRVLLDVLHLGSQRKVVRVNQVAFLGLKDSNSLDPLRAPYEELVENQDTPNPDFETGVAYQPPLMVRLGFEVGF